MNGVAESTTRKGLDFADVSTRIRVQPQFDSRYAVEVGKWLDVAHHNAGSYIDSCVGFMLLWALMQVVLHVAGLFGLVVLFVIGPTFQLGPVLAAVRVLRSEHVRFDAFFEGFRHLPNLLLLQVLMVLLLAGVAIPFLLLFQAVDGGAGAWLVAGLPAGCIALYLGVRAGFFTALIVVDRRVGPMKAIAMNWQMTRGHFWGLLGAGTVFLLVALLGVVVFFVGLFYTLPIVWMALAAGYLLATRQIAPSPRSFR